MKTLSSLRGGGGNAFRGKRRVKRAALRAERRGRERCTGRGPLLRFGLAPNVERLLAQRELADQLVHREAEAVHAGAGLNKSYPLRFDSRADVFIRNVFGENMLSVSSLHLFLSLEETNERKLLFERRVERRFRGVFFIPLSLHARARLL